MASIEKLPADGDARYIVVWQAAENFAGAQTMHVRASTSDNLIDWGPSRRISIPASGAIWAPVPFLHITNHPDDEGDFWLFYAESSTCVRDVPDLGRAYAPGGDIKYVRSRNGRSFGDPSFIYAQSAEGGIPKVIANKPLWHNGSVALPFWREHPGVADCKVAPYAMELSGTLLSQDDGKQWFVGGDVWSPKLKGTRLLEGALVELPREASEGPRLIQLFRSTGGKIWRAVSADGGRTWAKPRETSLPNPNSKVHAVQLSNGMIALAYNHHEKLEDALGGIRTKLWVALSVDEGLTWVTVARLEDQFLKKTKFHYPTLLELEGCRLAVVYTIGRKDHASEGGVRIALLELAPLMACMDAASQDCDPYQSPPQGHQQTDAQHMQRSQKAARPPVIASRSRLAHHKHGHDTSRMY